jgi:predicted RNA-binding Zn-ribbon protein involved in translation (DUF1610 family)
MAYCYNHPTKIQKVTGIKKIAEGKWKVAEFCPICDELEHKVFTCKHCHSKNDYYASPNCYPYQCLHCRDTGEKNDGKEVSFQANEIPHWRLNIDSATSDQVLKAKSNDFGMPTMSRQQWESYYANTPYEQRKIANFNKKKKTKDLETLKSL